MCMYAHLSVLNQSDLLEFLPRVHQHCTLINQKQLHHFYSSSAGVWEEKPLLGMWVNEATAMQKKSAILSCSIIVITAAVLYSRDEIQEKRVLFFAASSHTVVCPVERTHVEKQGWKQQQDAVLCKVTAALWLSEVF